MASRKLLVSLLKSFLIVLKSSGTPFLLHKDFEEFLMLLCIIACEQSVFSPRAQGTVIIIAL